MTGTNQFLVLELDTGRMDGWYAFDQDAAWAAEQRRLRTGGRWIVLRLQDAMRHQLKINPALAQVADMEADLK